MVLVPKWQAIKLKNTWISTASLPLWTFGFVERISPFSRKFCLLFRPDGWFCQKHFLHQRSENFLRAHCLECCRLVNHSNKSMLEMIRQSVVTSTARGLNPKQTLDCWHGSNGLCWQLLRSALQLFSTISTRRGAQGNPTQQSLAIGLYFIGSLATSN